MFLHYNLTKVLCQGSKNRTNRHEKQNKPVRKTRLGSACEADYEEVEDWAAAILALLRKEEGAWCINLLKALLNWEKLENPH